MIIISSFIAQFVLICSSVDCSKLMAIIIIYDHLCNTDSLITFIINLFNYENQKFPTINELPVLSSLNRIQNRYTFEIDRK